MFSLSPLRVASLVPSLVPSALKLLVVRLFGFELVFTLLLWGREVMGREGEGRGDYTC